MQTNFEKHCRMCVKEPETSVPLFNTTISESETYICDFLRQITSLEVMFLLICDC